MCYFGAYSRDSVRTINNIKALKKAGIEVVECWDRSVLPLRYLRLIKKHIGLKYDVMIVGWYGHSVLPLAKLITRKPIVLDAFIGLYETEVIDRKNIKSNSLRAKLYHYLDKCHFILADVCLVDTAAHRDYFCENFKVKRGKFKIFFVTTDDEFYYPKEVTKKDGVFRVLFEGGYTPLHGIEYIIEAAKLLESESDIVFELIGSGQTYEEIRSLSSRMNIRNIEFLPWMDYYKELPNYIAKADVCLGIFSKGIKASNVIPTKAVDALAMKKPLITGDSPAARELLKNQENCILVPMANSKALAEAILKLKNNDRLRQHIAQNGYELFKQRLSPEVIGRELKSSFHSVLKSDK